MCESKRPEINNGKWSEKENFLKESKFNFLFMKLERCMLYSVP